MLLKSTLIEVSLTGKVRLYLMYPDSGSFFSGVGLGQSQPGVKSMLNLEKNQVYMTILSVHINNLLNNLNKIHRKKSDNA